MTERYDAVIVGGGHNGLTAAAYLSRAGWRTLVLERRHVLGGAAVQDVEGRDAHGFLVPRWSGLTRRRAG